MKAELYTNCSLVRVPIVSGESEYYLPQNVEWAACKVDKLVVCAPQTACTDPVDGHTPVMIASDITDCYVSLYDVDGRELMHDVAAEQLVHTNNHPLYVNAKLNLSQCKITFTQAPSADATLLLYVFYGTRKEEYYDMPRKSVTAEFPLDADEQLTLQEVINTYIHALPSKVCGLVFWNAVSDPAFVSLRDYTLTYQMANIHSELARLDMNGGSADASQAQLFLLNDLDINFDYSYIRNATSSTNTQKITFLFN